MKYFHAITKWLNQSGVPLWVIIVTALFPTLSSQYLESAEQYRVRADFVLNALNNVNDDTKLIIDGLRNISNSEQTETSKYIDNTIDNVITLEWRLIGLQTIFEDKNSQNRIEKMLASLYKCREFIQNFREGKPINQSSLEELFRSLMTNNAELLRMLAEYAELT